MRSGGSGSISLPRLLQTLIPAEIERIAVSHATDVEVVAALGSDTLIRAPVVRGRTVWAPIDADLVVCQVPNALGLLDIEARHLYPRAIAVGVDPGVPTGSPWTAVVRRSNGAWKFGDEPTDRDRAEFTSRTSAARVLAPAVRQVRHVFVPHGRPESPRFAVQVRGTADIVCDDLNRRFPDYLRAVPLPAPAGGPGGLRVEVLGSDMQAGVAVEIAAVFGRS